MYKQCVTEQAARRQRELEKGLLEAMRSQSFEEINVSELCDRIGVPRKSFYRYFSGKEGALYALIDHTVMDFTGEVFKNEIGATMDTLERFFAFWKDRRQLLSALDRSGLSAVLIQRSIARAMEDDVMTDNLMLHHDEERRKYVIMFLVSGLLSLVLQWHYSDYKETPRHMAVTAAHLISKPLFSIPWKA